MPYEGKRLNISTAHYTLRQLRVVIFCDAVQDRTGKIVACREDRSLPRGLHRYVFDINRVGPEMYHPLLLWSIVHTKYLIDVSEHVSA